MKNTALISFLLAITVPAVMIAGVPVRISVKGSKPMMDICTEISNLFHWRITYEDPPVLNNNELVPERSPGGVSLLRLRAVPVSFAIPPKEAESMQDYRHKVMDTAIAAYSASGNGAAFTYVEDNDYIHVIPSSVTGSHGVLEPRGSILDVPVTIVPGRYSLGDIVSSVIGQVGNQVGTNISLGSFPTNIFASAMLTEEANKEPAKAVLMRVFEEINGPRYVAHVPPVRMYWILSYMPSGPQYFFSAHIEADELDDAAVSQISRSGAERPVGSAPDGVQQKAGFVIVPK